MVPNYYINDQRPSQYEGVKNREMPLVVLVLVEWAVVVLVDWLHDGHIPTSPEEEKSEMPAAVVVLLVLPVVVVVVSGTGGAACTN